MHGHAPDTGGANRLGDVDDTKVETTSEPKCTYNVNHAPSPPTDTICSTQPLPQSSGTPCCPGQSAREGVTCVKVVRSYQQDTYRALQIHTGMPHSVVSRALVFAPHGPRSAHSTLNF